MLVAIALAMQLTNRSNPKAGLSTTDIQKNVAGRQQFLQQLNENEMVLKVTAGLQLCHDTFRCQVKALCMSSWASLACYTGTQSP